LAVPAKGRGPVELVSQGGGAVKWG